MSSRPYNFNYKKPADKYFDNNNLYQQNNNNDNSYQQNNIMNKNNELNEQNRITSIIPIGVNIRKNQNNNDYNKGNFNYGNDSSNPNENYNNNYNNKNFNLNQRNINIQDYNGYHYFEQKKHNELILKILIYIYYYEKDLSQKNIFINSNEKYYLINQNWFNQFKNFYSYNKLKIQLDSIKNHDYDFFFIDIYVDDIINKIIQTTKTNYQLLPQNLKTNIFSEQKGIIIPQKIMNLIYELDQDSINFEKSNRFIFKYNGNIYYINNKTIFFGTFQKSALFEPKYLFEYNSIEIESNEEKKIIYYNINEYIKEKNCNLQKYRQILRNGDANIGALIIPSLKRQQSGGNNNQSKNPQKQPFNMMNLDIKNINNNIDNQNKESNNYNKVGVQIAKKIKDNDIINQNNINTNNNLKQELFNVNNTDNNKNKDNKMINNLTTPKNNIDEGKELLKTFIYIYYYEKSLAEKNIFLNNKENYYLINTDWLYNFKKLYLYEKIENILKTKEGIYDYNIINYIIDSIIKNELKEIQLQKIQFNENKNALSNIWPGLNRNKDIVYISRGIIFPSKIMNIIKNVYKEFKSLQIKRLIFKEDYIYYFNKEKIIVGIYQKSALFKPKYIFTYKSSDLEKIEEEKMISSNINEYLKQRNCDDKSGYQILKNELDEEIGSLIIILSNKVNSNKKIEKKAPNINNKNIKNENQKSQTTDDKEKITNIQDQQKIMENEIFKNNNNLNIQIKNLEQELKKKDKQILNNNIEIEKLKKENNLILKSKNEKDNEIQNLKNEISQLKNNEIQILSFQNKEQEIEKIKKDFNELDNKYKILNQRNKQFVDENIRYKGQISLFIKEKENYIKNNRFKNKLYFISIKFENILK